MRHFVLYVVLNTPSGFVDFCERNGILVDADDSNTAYFLESSRKRSFEAAVSSSSVQVDPDFAAFCLRHGLDVVSDADHSADVTSPPHRLKQRSVGLAPPATTVLYNSDSDEEPCRWSFTEDEPAMPPPVVDEGDFEDWRAFLAGKRRECRSDSNGAASVPAWWDGADPALLREESPPREEPPSFLRRRSWAGPLCGPKEFVSHPFPSDTEPRGTASFGSFSGVTLDHAATAKVAASLTYRDSITQHDPQALAAIAADDKVLETALPSPATAHSGGGMCTEVMVPSQGSAVASKEASTTQSGGATLAAAIAEGGLAAAAAAAAVATTTTIVVAPPLPPRKEDSARQERLQWARLLWTAAVSMTAAAALVMALFCCCFGVLAGTGRECLQAARQAGGGDACQDMEGAAMTAEVTTLAAAATAVTRCGAQTVQCGVIPAEADAKADRAAGCMPDRKATVLHQRVAALESEVAFYEAAAAAESSRAAQLDAQLAADRARFAAELSSIRREHALALAAAHGTVGRQGAAIEASREDGATHADADAITVAPASTAAAVAGAPSVVASVDSELMPVTASEAATKAAAGNEAGLAAAHAPREALAADSEEPAATEKRAVALVEGRHEELAAEEDAVAVTTTAADEDAVAVTATAAEEDAVAVTATAAGCARPAREAAPVAALAADSESAPSTAANASPSATVDDPVNESPERAAEEENGFSLWKVVLCCLVLAGDKALFIAGVAILLLLHEIIKSSASQQSCPLKAVSLRRGLPAQDAPCLFRRGAAAAFAILALVCHGQAAPKATAAGIDEGTSLDWLALSPPEIHVATIAVGMACVLALAVWLMAAGVVCDAAGLWQRNSGRKGGTARHHGN
ncbi:unnamed protein product [Phaeothamnion confervicola]